MNDQRLLLAVKMAYRKHVMNDESIGWVELGDELMTALSETMGDEGFQEWLEEVKRMSYGVWG